MLKVQGKWLTNNADGRGAKNNEQGARNVSGRRKENIQYSKHKL